MKKMNRKMAKRLVNKDEAVSPVIAVILMVAITVVLVATLYIMIQGMTNTSGGELKINEGTTRITDFASGGKSVKIGSYVNLGSSVTTVSITSLSFSMSTSSGPLTDYDANLADTETTHYFTLSSNKYYCVVADSSVDVTDGNGNILWHNSTKTADSTNTTAPSSLSDLTNVLYIIYNKNADSYLDSGEYVYIFKQGSTALGSSTTFSISSDSKEMISISLANK